MNNYTTFIVEVIWTNLKLLTTSNLIIRGGKQ